MSGGAPKRRRRWLAIALGAAQIAAAGTAQAECGPYEDETRTTYRELRWGDFRGRRPPQVPTRGRRPAEVAHVATSITYQTEVTTRRVGTEWVASPAALCVQAFVLKDRSGYKRERRSSWDLAHEQGHFDITHYFAETLRTRLAGFEHRATTELEARDGLLERMERARVDTIARWRRMQARYDEETRHSQRKPEQRRWRDRIALLLEALPAERVSSARVADAGVKTATPGPAPR